MTRKERQLLMELREHDEAKECYTGEDLKYFYKLTCRQSIYNSDAALVDVDFSRILRYLETEGKKCEQ